MILNVNILKVKFIGYSCQIKYVFFLILDIHSTEVFPDLQSLELQDIIFDDQPNPKISTNKDIIHEKSSCDIDDPDWRPQEDEVQTDEGLVEGVTEDNGHVEEGQQNKKRKARGKVAQPEEWEKINVKKEEC